MSSSLLACEANSIFPATRIFLLTEMPHCGIEAVFSKEEFSKLPDEQQRIQKGTKKTEKNPKGVGPAAGRVAQSRPQLRAGVADHSVSCGAPAAFSDFPNAGHPKRKKGVLGAKEVSPQAEKAVPGLGVSGWQNVLVYLGDNVRG